MDFFKKDNKFKSILDERSKIPTAAQVRTMLKDEWHMWTNMERIIASVVLIPADVLTCTEDIESTRRRLGEDFPADIESFRSNAHKRLDYLNSLLTQITIDIENYNAYDEGIKKPTGNESFPPKLAWSMKRHNDHVRLMQFIHEIDKRREYEATGPITIIVNPDKNELP